MTGLEETILVALPELTVARLMGMRRSSSERLADVVDRMAAAVDPQARGRDKSGPDPCAGQGRYLMRVLDGSKAVWTLAEALTFALKILADLDVGILARLENTGGRTRRNVARSREASHPGRPDLNTLYAREFRPGWWSARTTLIAMFAGYSETSVVRRA